MNFSMRGQECTGFLRVRVELCGFFRGSHGEPWAGRSRLSDVSGLEFRCLVTDDHREHIDAVAFELNARVSYFRGSMNVISISRDGEYLGCVWGSDFGSLEKAVLEVLNAG